MLCTTSVGGHLSWFELDGKRWFARAVCIQHDRWMIPADRACQASAFLQKMASDVNLEALDGLRTPQVARGTSEDDHGPVFLPMRRKLKITA